MIFVDSSVWIDIFKGVRNERTDRLMAAPARNIIAGDMVVYEVLRGARDDLHAKRLQTQFDAFRQACVLTHDIAVKAAANYRQLRSLGITIRKDADVIIGTWCIENNVPLLHNDRDFLPMVEHLGLIQF